MPQHLLEIPGNNPAWLTDDRVFALVRRVSKGRESLGMAALRKQMESQTSFPWKVKHREHSSPFINKTGKLLQVKVTENNTRNV